MSTDTSAMPARPSHDDDQLAAARSLLEQQWRHQVDHIVDLSYDALADAPERDEVGSAATDRLLNSRLLAAARQQLQETEEALTRLKDGTYGTCVRCGEQITPERLEILPAAGYCIACQSRRPAT